jgi:hypothetical protein
LVVKRKGHDPISLAKFIEGYGSGLREQPLPKGYRSSNSSAEALIIAATLIVT